MKITFIIGSLGYGGKERQLYYLIKNLPEGIDKQLIILSENIKIEDIFSHVDKLVIIPLNEKYKIRTLKKVYKEVDQFATDIIHSWDYISPILLKPLAILRNIKLINGSIRTARPLKILSCDFMIRNFIEKISDMNISNSKKGLEIKGLSNKSNSTWIHNGFDINDFDSRMDDVQLVDYIDTSDFNICMIGSCYPAKDYKTLIEVCEIVNKKSTGVKIKFHAFGDGPFLQSYKKMVEDRSIDNFIFYGTSNDIPAHLSKCDVGILLNPVDYSEGISNATMEYMAAGLPVIATNSGGTPELVQDNITGFLVKPYDAEIVANKILEFKSNKKLKDKMGCEGRRIIIDEYSIDKMIEKYIKIYNNLLIE